MGLSPESKRRRRAMRRKLGIVTILLTLILSAGAATADDIGEVGSIVSLDVFTTPADTYLQYHGRMFVKRSDGVLDEYRWGGTSCGSRTLTEGQWAALQSALNHKKMTITPTSQDGQGPSKCLVGFSLVEKKNLKLF
jgi:hypothetical protein